ncbi:hypothetical protein ACSAZL_05705 [Methanosarcina sp. T3]|uniref:hypothetical protein n=1 Tax=Methanosarcina sp. T3 TaxID=3439062 RepID=UPI003F83630E
MDLLVGSVFLLIVLALILHFYKIRLLSHSLKLCNWICGLAIGSDSPWVKMMALHLVFLVRLLMYLAIVSLEQVDKLTTRGLLKHYISGTRLVLLEYLSVFLNPSEEVEKYIYSLNTLNSSASKKKQHLRK